MFEAVGESQQHFPDEAPDTASSIGTSRATTFLVAKANGKVVCTRPDYKNAPVGICDHILELKEQGDSANWPAIRQEETARLLEHPFRPNQVKLKDGLAYVEGATVIQRLNDVLRTGN